MATHELGLKNLHHCWDNSIVPALEIEPGDTVIFETRDASDGQIWPKITEEELAKAEPRGHPLTGPVFVKGAQPGDTLEIEVLDVQTGEWGWTGFQPGLGLLPDDFETGYLHFWDLRSKSAPAGLAEFLPGIYVPVEPFCGVMGVAWDEPGQFSTVPPRPAGGNMDIRQLTAGSRLQLPVTVDGALFSVGDCHAAQGDGEVCGTAIETNGVATLRFTLKRQARLSEPRFWTPKTAANRLGEKGYFVTTAHHPDLQHASRQAIRYMREYLVDTYRLSDRDAYALCSVVVDLKISQIVDRPNWTVSAFLPEAIFSF